MSSADVVQARGVDPKVITQEEVDALMRGFESELVDAPEARAGSTRILPGQRVDLSLDLPAQPRRTLPTWRSRPRPIESWPWAAPRLAAPMQGWRPSRRPAPAGPSTTDYWPAYADALSNVVLNLLFLVGLFTMGLVVLNQEVIARQLKLAEERARVLLLQREAAPRPAHAAAAQPPLAPAPVVPPPPPPAPAAPEPVVEPPVREFAMRRERPPAAGVIGPSGAPSAPSTTPEAVAQATMGGRFVTRLTFDLRETAWPAARPIVGAEGLAPGDRRALVAFAPPDNRRLMTEAFSRLTSVRNQMVASGVAARDIVLRIAPLPPELESDDVASRTVYVINLEGS